MCEIIAIDNAKLVVPLKKVDFAIKIVNMLSHVSVNQYYENFNDTNIEAKYKFSMPSGATVYNFQARIGDKLIRTKIEEKSEAKKIYQNAIETGDSAYYMEETNGDIFTCMLGNIPAKTNVIIEINYTCELKTESDSKNLRFNLPISMMPRYVPAQTKNFDQITLNPTFSLDRPYQMSVRGQIYMTDGIESVNSVGYKITQIPKSEQEINFQIDNLETNDIIIVIRRKYNMTWAISQVGPFEKYRHVTFLNIYPEFEKISQANINEIHYSLILDCSGSMQGECIENCKNAANLFVAKLPLGSVFDLYKFSDDYEKFTTEAEKGSIEYKTDASKWINNIEANGGTEVYEVLMNAMNSTKDHRGIIIFISDGGVSNTNKVLKLVKSYPNIRIFTLGIGSNVSQELIQKMADLSNGIAEWIANDGDNIDAKVNAQIKRAQQKVVSKNIIQVHTDGLYRMVPENVPVIYENTNNIVYILSENIVKSVDYVYDYEYNDADKKCKQTSVQTLNPQYLELDINSAFHRLAGSKLIKSLNTSNKEEIIETSKLLGILSPHTSFIGVEVREEVDKLTNKPTFVDVPVQISKNYVSRKRHHSYGIDECFMMNSLENQSAEISSVESMEYDCEDDESSDLFGGTSFVNKSAALPIPQSASYNIRSFSNVTKKVTNFFQSTLTNTTHEEKIKIIEAKLQEPQYKSAKRIVDDVLPKCRLLGNYLTAEANGVLDVTLNVNDFVVITKDGVEGIYKVITIGSKDEPWVLQLN